MGAAVLCAGNTRFNRSPTVFFPQTIESHREKAEELLDAEKIEVPPEFQRNARRFLYYQLFRGSLPFDGFLREDNVWPGYAALKPIRWQMLLSENSPALKTIVDGIISGAPFILSEQEHLTVRGMKKGTQ